MKFLNSLVTLSSGRHSGEHSSTTSSFLRSWKSSELRSPVDISSPTVFQRSMERAGSSHSPWSTDEGALSVPVSSEDVVLELTTATPDAHGHHMTMKLPVNTVCTLGGGWLCFSTHSSVMGFFRKFIFHLVK